MKRRLLIVTLAAVLALAGTGSVLVYVKHADARAIAGLRAVSVLVATKQIPSGTSAQTALTEGLLDSQRLPADSVPADALRSVSPGQRSLVMSADVEPGQLLLAPMLVPAAQVTGGLAIPAGMMAVTIQLCVPEAVAGNLRAGSQVTIFDTSGSGNSQMTATPACGGPHQQQGSVAKTRMVLPKATVISVGPGPAAGGGAGSGSGFGQSNSSPAASSQGSLLVTLALSKSDAERVIQLTETGLPYLALLTPSSQAGLDTQPVP